MSNRDRPLRFLVTDLLARPGTGRPVKASVALGIEVESARVIDPVRMEAVLEGLADGVLAKTTVEFDAVIRCNRCLREWQEPRRVPFLEVFTRHLDEDGRMIDREGRIDLEPAMLDEVVVSLPLVALCRPDCAGLCPTCGTDLNEAPCSGHADELDSPFAPLRELFDEED